MKFPRHWALGSVGAGFAHLLARPHGRPRLAAGLIGRFFMG